MLADRSRAVAVAVLAACLLLLAAAWHPHAARADGDPASDVLLYQPIYFPYQPAPAAVKRRLTGLVRSANSQGYQIRVAVVQSPRDLGSVPELFAKPPAVYARFLSAELTSAWRHRVLIVFPTGYGLAEGGAHFVKVKGVLQIRENPIPGSDKAVLQALQPPSGSSPTALIDAAGRALRALAARHDVSLVADIPSSHTSSGGGRSRGSELLAAAVSATVGLTVGLLWYLWRTRPTHRTMDGE
jgi:hypothetical protein